MFIEKMNIANIDTINIIKANIEIAVANGIIPRSNALHVTRSTTLLDFLHYAKDYRISSHALLRAQNDVFKSGVDALHTLLDQVYYAREQAGHRRDCTEFIDDDKYLRFTADEVLRFRNARCMTQNDLARVSGLSRKTIGRAESARHDSSIGTLIAIAAALNEPVEHIIPETRSKNELDYHAAYAFLDAIRKNSAIVSQLMDGA